ncbi:uncharacterized protein LOC118486608 [Helianthus annuus]|uniref:uncharacterized protein LOC118486608 n=1 Tax=Helianthus annuus TaxID=4232 RepID=UPI001652C455|nr:uncharacterized protein LOC118486608 [Helianthus annuus]
MATVQMAKDWNATYPQVGDTGADAPAGYITLWADFFTHGNLRLPVTVFVAEVLEYYHLHISQLSPFGMHGSLKLMTPPKGVTGWKKRFFYVKACAVYANMSFRNVDVGVSDEDIPVASAKTADWFSRLRPIELKKLDNDQLWILRMMLSRPDRKERPVLREQGGADAVGLWRMFEPDFKGQVELIAVELKKGFNLEILNNFRVPSKAVLEVPVPGDARGVLADLGKFEKRVPKKTVEKKTVKKTVRGRGKGSVEGSAAPSSVFKAAESRDAGYSFFDIPASPPHTAAAGAGVTKETVAPKEPVAPFVGPVRDPPLEKTVETTVDRIFDTVDSSDNLISPDEGDGLNLRFSDAGKQKSDAEGDDISNDPAACKEILGGLGTPFEVERARAAPRELRVNQLSSMLAREVAVTDLTTRVSAAEKRADAVAEAKNALVSSFNQLEADREWLRTHGIARIVEAIMNAPETSSGLDLVKERAREAGFKAGFNRCIGHINVLSAGGYTDQASGFRDVDTEGRLKAAVASFYDTPLACVGELDECLEVADYVDRLRMLYPDVEEEEPAGGAGGDAGTSGTK